MGEKKWFETGRAQENNKSNQSVSDKKYFFVCYPVVLKSEGLKNNKEQRDEKTDINSSPEFLRKVVRIGMVYFLKKVPR